MSVFDNDPNESRYGYTPSRAATIIFVILFGISSILHLGQAVRYRTWFMLITALLCGVMETVGWSARFFSSFHPTNTTAYTIQTSVLVLAPTPLLAANFVIFGRLIRKLGERYSRIKPRFYTIIFTSCDILSIFIQGSGGGLAASGKSVDSVRLGSNIVLAGITLQAIIIAGFSLCAIEYFVRYRTVTRTQTDFRLIATDEPSDASQDLLPGRFTPDLQRLTLALIASTTLLFIRATYRIVELSGGWDGRIMRTEVYFNVLDGAMIVLAIYCTNIVHPGAALGSSKAKRVPLVA